MSRSVAPCTSTSTSAAQPPLTAARAANLLPHARTSPLPPPPTAEHAAPLLARPAAAPAAAGRRDAGQAAAERRGERCREAGSAGRARRSGADPAAGPAARRAAWGRAGRRRAGCMQMLAGRLAGWRCRGAAVPPQAAHRRLPACLPACRTRSPSCPAAGPPSPTSAASSPTRTGRGAATCSTAAWCRPQMTSAGRWAGGGRRQQLAAAGSSRQQPAAAAAAAPPCEPLLLHSHRSACERASLLPRQPRRLPFQPLAGEAPQALLL